MTRTEQDWTSIVAASAVIGALVVAAIVVFLA